MHVYWLWCAWQLSKTPKRRKITMSRLPDDLLICIMKFSVDSVRTLCDMYTISKRFHSILRKPLMITHVPIRSSELVHLGLLYPGVRDVFFDAVYLPPLPLTVTTLDLNHCASDIARVVAHLRNLTSLNVYACGVEELKILTHLPLKTLKIGGNDLIDLQAVNKFTKLQVLHLHDFDYHALCDGIDAVAHLTHLHTLVLAGAYLDDFLVQDLEPLSNTLKRLSLAHTPVGDLGASVLARFKKLDTLDLGYCSMLTENTMRVVSTLRNLENFFAPNCDMVTQDSLWWLSGLMKLEILDISNHLPKSLDLQPLSQLLNLRALNVSGCQVRHPPKARMSNINSGVYF
jgi:Leucine-rich repeat (LRR) protein